MVGSFVTFTGGILTYRVFTDARTFAQLARSLSAVDLLDRDALLPFARQGLRSAVPGVIFVTFFALNLGDAGFQFASGWIMAVVVVQNAVMLLIPMRGVHERLRATKHDELARVNAAIRGDAARAARIAARTARASCARGSARVARVRRVGAGVADRSCRRWAASRLTWASRCSAGSASALRPARARVRR